MEKKLNVAQISSQLKEIRENLWRLEKTIGIQTDDLYIYKMMKDLEARMNIVEIHLKITDYADTL